MKKPKLKLVSDRRSSSPHQPSRPLGKFGLALWDAVHGENDVNDAAGLQMLMQACTMLDRAEELHEQIERDGLVTMTRMGLKENPGLKHELAARSFVVKTLKALGLNLEEIRAPGRPSRGYGI